MRVWFPKGHTPIVRVSASRDNTHFYGALNLASGQETLLRSDLMKGEVSALFLQKLLDAYPDVPLLLLWDRAPWHQGEAIKAVLAANARLEILWFPPGCPELNRASTRSEGHRSMSGKPLGRRSGIIINVRR